MELLKIPIMELIELPIIELLELHVFKLSSNYGITVDNYVYKKIQALSI